MTAGTSRKRAFVIPTLLAALALLAAWGCSSKAKSNDAATDPAGDAKSVASSNSGASQVDLLCIGDRINDPPEPFHYTYQYTAASGSVSKEADITPQAMEITIKDQSGTHSYHGTRADETSWGQAVLDLSNLNIAVLSGRLALLKDSSAITRHGQEAVNGYGTVKYAIDTTAANSSDQKKYETLFGKGSYENGSVWVPADGCAVKLVLDEGIARPDGNVEKVHYQIARIRK
jgi:hypothetical protein